MGYFKFHVWRVSAGERGAIEGQLERPSGYGFWEELPDLKAAWRFADKLFGKHYRRVGYDPFTRRVIGIRRGDLDPAQDHCLVAVGEDEPFVSREEVRANRQRAWRTAAEAAARSVVIVPMSQLSVDLRNRVRPARTGCWIWMGSLRPNGYGVQAGLAAHRVVFSTTVRPLRSDELLRHLCHIRACVNPAHLAPGSEGENIVDTMAMGRLFRRPPPRVRRKVPIGRELHALRVAHWADGLSIADLAEAYGMPSALMHDLIHYRFDSLRDGA